MMSRTDNVHLSDLLLKLYGNSDEAIFFFDRQGKVLDDEFCSRRDFGQ